MEVTTQEFVVVYGASDDLMEFAGAIDDEADVCNGGIVHIDAKGIISREALGIDDGATDEAIEEYSWRKVRSRSIRAVWGKGETSWSYETDIPHATFDVLEGDEVYCRGIVFALADLLRSGTAGSDA